MESSAASTTGASHAATLRWGVLSTARIATNKVIPAINGSGRGEVLAMSSRTLAAAQHAAEAAGVERAYGTYEALLADPDIDAIYNPLPNHLHVPWTIKALEAGKHVLCEKPVALNATEARHLVAAAANYPDLVVMEAFMYRFHPQWVRAKALADSGALGGLRSTQTHFSYFTEDPANIRHNPEWGGGALFDIGCYPVSQARWLFGDEPAHVVAMSDIDARFGVDRLTSGMLRFEHGHATFTCSMQLQPYQRTVLHFESGRFEIEIPVNAPAGQPTRAWLSTANGTVEETFAACDQYALQADGFAEAVARGIEAPTPLVDAVANMEALDALVESAATQSWVAVKDA